MNYYHILILILILFSCSDIEEEVYGCTDKEACNYNPDATSNWEDECIYQDVGCDCEDEFLNAAICDCDGSIDSDFDDICDNIDICIGEYDNNYFCDDLHVLEDFINLNPSSGLASLSVYDLVDQNNQYCDFTFGTNRLKYLSLPGQYIYIVPNTINKLDSLEYLYLNNNNISVLDSSICDINDFVEIFLQENKLCEEYHFDCIDHWGQQDCDE